MEKIILEETSAVLEKLKEITELLDKILLELECR